MLDFLNLPRRDKEEIKRARVILMCGLPGSGKSTLAKKLSEKVKAEIVCSDKIRSQLFASARFEENGDISIKGWREKYYAVLIKKTLALVSQGKKVIVDATNMDEQRGKLISRLLNLINQSEILIIVLKTPKKTISHRMKALKGTVNRKETYFTAWARVCGYFIENLRQGKYFWPSKEEGAAIIKIENFSL